MSKNINVNVLIKSFFVNLSLVIVKIIVGIFGNSKSLIADGFHSLSDLGTDLLSIVSSKLSNKPADDEHPLGHGNIEYLCCLAIGLVVTVLGFNLTINAFNGELNIPSNIVLYVTIFTIISKYLLSSYILKKGRKYSNSLLIASGKESRADVLSSVVVLIAFIFSKLTKYNEIFKYSDLIGTVILGIFIIFIGVKIFIENFTTIICSKEDNPEVIKNIINIVNKYQEITIDDILLLKYGSYYKCELDIFMNGDMKINDSYLITKKLKKELLKSNLNINYIDINIKPKKEK